MVEHQQVWDFGSLGALKLCLAGISNPPSTKPYPPQLNPKKETLNPKLLGKDWKFLRAAMTRASFWLASVGMKLHSSKVTV